MVGLDTSPMDELLVKYATFVASNSSAETVEFINIVRSLNIPENVKKEFPEIVENAMKERKGTIKRFKT